MTVHAHPDDETIGTGGTMATSVRAGRRVVLVTCTRGEMGEIVVPDMDTPDNHRRLGEIRAGELERAMDALGVTEWENLGYRDSDMMGRTGNLDARCFWQADLDEAIGRLVFLVRTYQPDVMTTYNDFGGYGHPDHIRTHLVAVGAFARAGDPAWYPEQVAPEHGGTGAPAAEGGLAPWTPAKLYEQAIPASVRDAMRERMEALGEKSFWSAPEDASPEELTEWETRRRGCSSRTSRSPPGSTSSDVLDAALGRDQGARDPDQRREPVRPLRQGGLGRVLEPRGVHPPRDRGSRRPTTRPTCSRAWTGSEPGPYGWADAVPAATTGAP